MTKKAFDKIMSGLSDAVEIAQGRATPGTFKVHVPGEIDVRAIRKNLGMTQDEFASHFGFSKAAVRDWEQGRARPLAASRVLLVVIDKEPEAVQRALQVA